MQDKTFLLSSDCKSFKQFQHKRSQQPSFRQFYSMLAHDLTVKVASMDLDDSDLEKSNQDTNIIPEGAVQIA